MSFLNTNLDTKLLIEQVKVRPHLWNPAHPEYRLREERNESWMEICTALIDGFDKMDGQAQEKIMHKVRTRWKTARDSYIKLGNKPKTPDDTGDKRKKRTSNYLKHLSFLKQILKRNTPEDSDKVVNVEYDSSSQDASEIKQEEIETVEVVDDEDMEVSTSAFEEVTVPCPEISQEEDDDRSFLMSLLPMIRKLDHDQKLAFRLEVLQSIIRIKNEKCILP